SRLAWTSLVALGSVYALFCVLLHREGVPARAVPLPVSPTSYYALQAGFVGPWLALLATVYAAIAWRVCRRSPGDPPFRRVWESLVPRYALWLLGGFVLPDLVVFLWAGHAALPAAMRYYGAVAPV